MSMSRVNTLNAGIGFTKRKSVFLSQFLVILTCILRINEPIPGMFVLIWMHFSYWFQMSSLKSRMLTFVNIFGHFWLSSAHACRVESINNIYIEEHCRKKKQIERKESSTLNNTSNSLYEIFININNILINDHINCIQHKRRNASWVWNQIIFKFYENMMVIGLPYYAISQLKSQSLKNSTFHVIPVVNHV